MLDLKLQLKNLHDIDQLEGIAKTIARDHDIYLDFCEKLCEYRTYFMLHVKRQRVQKLTP